MAVELYHAMSKQDWYSAKTIYKHHRVEADKTKTVFEERVVLLRATGFDDAIAKAEAEAAVYCGTDVDAIYLEFVDVFHLFDEKIGHGTELNRDRRSASVVLNEISNWRAGQHQGDCLGKRMSWPGSHGPTRRIGW